MAASVVLEHHFVSQRGFPGGSHQGVMLCCALAKPLTGNVLCLAARKAVGMENNSRKRSRTLCKGMLSKPRKHNFRCLYACNLVLDFFPQGKWLGLDKILGVNGWNCV